MNRPIRRVGYAVTALLLLLVAQLVYLQVIDADNLENDPRNVRTQLRDFNRPRGEIVTADGAVAARSVPSKGEFKFQREYPLGQTLGQITGFQSFSVGNAGVEETYDRVLTGRDTSLQLGDLGALVSGNADTNNVVLTISEANQRKARELLNLQKGSIVAIDVQTGGIEAMYSNPSFDPTPLASHNRDVVQRYFDFITSDASDQAALPRSYRQIFPPGSSFKPVTAGAAIDLGKATPTDPVFPTRTELPLPQTNIPLRNSGGNSCGGTLTESLVHSCNTTFALLGLEMGNDFVPAMERCGVGSDAPPLDLSPGAARSVGPLPGSFDDNKPLFARAGIGQGQAVTPLEMALIAAGIAHGGTIMTPHVVDHVENEAGETVRRTTPKPWLECMPPSTAIAVGGMMVQVVEEGTGTPAQIPGVAVAGKTGTAQVEGKLPHAWFIAFAPANAPRYAVAVMIENGGGGQDPEITGGQTAGPIAREMLEMLLAQ